MAKVVEKRWVALHGAEIVYMEKEPTVDNTADMVITKAQVRQDYKLNFGSDHIDLS